MTYFHIKLDDKFDELFTKVRTTKKRISEKDLRNLKAYILDVYDNENDCDDESISNGFRMLKIEPDFEDDCHQSSSG